MQPEETSVYISVTEPVEPLGSTLYLFGQLRSFGSVSDRYKYPTIKRIFKEPEPKSNTNSISNTKPKPK